MHHRVHRARGGFPVLFAAALMLCAGGAYARKISLVTYLTTTNEVLPVPPPIPGNSEGIALCMVDTDANTMDYYIEWGALSSPEIPSHLHGDSTPDTLGPILVTLPMGNPKIGQLTYEEANEAEIITGGSYLNIHTEMNPLGELRGQLVSFVAIMEGAQAIPASGSAHVGIGFFMIDEAANTLSYYIRDSVPDPAETGAAIYGFAPHGAAGTLLHALPAASPKIGTWNYTEAQESSILHGLAYIGINTGPHPGGEIRGQVVNLLTFLDAAGESSPPAGAENAFGIGNFSYDRDGGRLGYRVVHQLLTSAETGAHLHGYAPAGRDAGVLAGLPPGLPKIGFWDFSGAGIGPLSEIYVNIHTANNPGGEIRGQIREAVAASLVVDYLLGKSDGGLELDANGDGVLDAADVVSAVRTASAGAAFRQYPPQSAAGGNHACASATH